MQNNDSGSQRNVTIVSGWNLIGYSAEDNLSHSDVRFTNNTGAVMTMSEASQRGYVQKYFGYLKDNGSANKRYNYVPKDEASLEGGNGYWVYANTGVSGNLTLNGVGGSPKNETYKLTDLMFRNVTGVEKNVTDALSAGWVGGVNSNSVIYYWDLDSEDWGNVLSTQSFNSWQGYFINGRQNNLTLLRQN